MDNTALNNYVYGHRPYSSRFRPESFFSLTRSQIYNKEKREQVNAFLFNKSVMDSNTLLFDPINQKICHKLCLRSIGSLVSMAHKERK